MGSINLFMVYFTPIMMSSLQCRMARAALNWSNAQLADAADVGVNTVSRLEQGADVRLSSAEAMQAALEAAGVEFILAGQHSADGGVGIRLRKTD